MANSKKCKVVWGKRTFEAKKHPKGSNKRRELNKDNRTSEYLPSYKYYIKQFNPATHGKKELSSGSTTSLTEANKQIQEIVDARGCTVIREK